MTPAIRSCQLASLADVPHPFPYQGSKRGLAHSIIRLLPEDTTEFVEPFAGSGAMSIAARHTGAAASASLSDVNEPLMALWGRILDDPDGLAADYEAVWTEQSADPRAYYDEARRKFNATGEPHLLLYLLNRCVKAAVRYSKTGEFNQSADNRRLGAKPATVRKRIATTSATMKGSHVVAGDYASALFATPAGGVCYLDPPYQGVTNVADHRYLHGLERAGFEAVLRDAVTADVSFLVSYDVVTQDNKYGEQLSPTLGLTHLHLHAGRSSQATLSGEKVDTVESLYLSPALVARLGGEQQVYDRVRAAADAAGEPVEEWVASRFDRLLE
ncbi:MAG TPA: DNA adenine methylase [Jatrophihabitans sp.]|nr:DNA adenine methylase [Jatrophihabitans sp.]